MLRIGFLSPHSPIDQNSFSGTTFYMYQALCKLDGVTVRAMAPLETSKKERFLAIFKKLRHRNISAFGYIEAVIGLLENARYKKIRNAIYKESVNYDVIVAPVASDIIGGMNNGNNLPPVLFITDATYKFLEEEYKWYMSERHKRNEDNTVRLAAAVIYSSEFMVSRATKEFNIESHLDNNKFCYIPFGLNMDVVVGARRKTLAQKQVRLLFIGKDWNRKGGEIALEASQLLREKGIDATLDIVGSDPISAQGKNWVRVHPFIDKNAPQEREKFHQLLEQSHFLILPTRADCTPMVIAEANAFGVPALVTSVGGIPSLVKHGESGFLLDLKADASEYASIIQYCHLNPQYYSQLSRGAIEIYERKLNWNAWARSVVEKAESILDSGSVSDTRVDQSCAKAADP